MAKKVYVTPLSEDVLFGDPIMVDYLGIAQVSGGAATVSGGQGA